MCRPAGLRSEPSGFALGSTDARTVSMLVVGALALVASACLPAPSVPEPRLDCVEPPVAEEIRARGSAVLEEPEDGERWGRYGMVLDAHGLDVDAQVAYEHAADLDPSDFRWPYFRAALLEASSLERAVSVYRH